MGKQVNVVLLTGCKGGGKDTAAKPLIDRGWVRLAFADPLRKMALAINPIVECEIDNSEEHNEPREIRLRELVEAYGWDSTKKLPEVRRLLQVIGTEAVREIIGQDTWTDLAFNAAFDLVTEGKKVVITDCRFDNEAEVLDCHPFEPRVVQIVRDGFVPDGHASEAGIDPELVDEVVENNGTIEELHAKILAIAGEAS